MSTAAPSPATPAAVPQVEDCGPRLRELYPALFTSPPRPIKLRIQADIQARSPGEFTKPQLSAFLRRYTGSFAYLNSLVKATHRFDLDGNPGDEVSAEHRQAALDELARRRANHQARVALEAQQRMNRAILLHDFERTTLTPANFSALKGIPVDELEPLLARARQEAAEAPPAPDRRHRGPPSNRGDRPPRRDAPHHGTDAAGAAPSPERGQVPRPEREGGPRPPGSRPGREGGPGPSSPFEREGGPRPASRPERASGARPGGNPPSGRGPGPGGDRPRGPRPESSNRKARPEPRAAAPGGPAGGPGPRVEFVAPQAAPQTAMAAALAAARMAAASKEVTAVAAEHAPPGPPQEPGSRQPES